MLSQGVEEPVQVTTPANVHLPYKQQPQPHHRVLASLARKYTPRGRVLDVGCGLGYTLAELRRLAPQLELFGSDIDEVCISETRDRVPGVRLLPMRPDRFDVESLGSGFDTVLMSHVLEHLPHPGEVVRDLERIVRPGGHLVLGVPNPVSPANLLFTMLRRQRVNPGHLHTWDRPHWMNFLEQRLGVDVVEYAEDELRIFPVRLKQYLRGLEAIQVVLAKPFPWWCFTQFAVVRRRFAEAGA